MSDGDPYAYHHPGPDARHVPPAVPAPARRRWDLGLSITLLALAGVLVGLSALLGLFALAFLDHCPPATCSTTGALGAVLLGLGAMAACAVTGLVLVIARRRRGRTAWPVALAALAATILALVATAAGYATAVDH